MSSADCAQKQTPNEQDTPAWQEIARERESIDNIDREIMQLLNRRAGHALEIARHKRSGSIATVWPHREQQVIQGVCSANQGPLPDEYLENVFREIISACRGLQRPLQVAFLGPEHTFSHQAVLSHFGNSCKPTPMGSVGEVFQQVERGHCQVGLVPVENSSEGGVSVTMDQFLTSDLQVCGEVYTPVRHVLMSGQDSLDGINKVYSHPQGLNQCRQWLAQNLPGVITVEAASTAQAAQMATQEPGSAAVGSQLAAGHQGLNILASDIQDLANNTTRLLVVGRQPCPASGTDKTSLLLVAAHRAGSLYRILGHFADRGINLSRIESRPTKDRPWEYAFFVDVEGHQEDEPVARAIEAMRADLEMLKVLGSYPAGAAGKRI